MSGRLSYKADFEPPVSESQAMKDYAVRLGVGANAILTGTESRDTFGNAFFTRTNLLEPLGINSVQVVAGPNHSRERLAYIFDKVFGGSYRRDFIMYTDERPDAMQRERDSLARLHDLFSGISSPGDDQAIYQRLRVQHPACGG